MASRRTRRAIGQGLSAAGESVGDLFRVMSQLGLQREKQEFEKGEQERDRRMELASILLGMADPERLPEILKDLPAIIEGGEFGKIPIKIPRPETLLGDLRKRIIEADTPEKIAGLGSLDLVAQEFAGQGGRFIRPGQIAPVGSPVRAALGGLEPQPNLEALGAVGQLARVAREREAALKPFIPTTRVEELHPETLAQTFEMVPQTEMAGRTGLAVPSPEDKALKDLLAAASAADRPESGRLFEIESGRRLSEEERKQRILTEEANKRAAFSQGLQTTAAAGAQQTEDQIKAERTADLAESMIGNIDLLLSPTGHLTGTMRKLVGPLRVPVSVARMMGGSVSSAQSAVDQLVGQQILNLMGELKAQSKTGATGFGQLSGPELALLEQSATRLTNQAMAEQDYAKLLTDLKGTLQRVVLAGRGLKPAVSHETTTPTTPMATSSGRRIVVRR